MCHERWAARRDELVETSWLRDLRSQRRERQDRPSPASPTEQPATEEPLTERHSEPVGAAER